MTSKTELRSLLISRRRSLDPQWRAQADAALIKALKSRLDPHAVVAAYNPFGTEPGGKELIPALYRHAAKVYLPISGADGQLLWAAYQGEENLRAGALGISEPTGRRYDSSVLKECDVVIVPALAIRPDGMRLGKGAGYYDRALAGLEGDTPQLWGVVFASEVRPDVPSEAHDEPVHAIVTEEGFRALA